MRKIIGVLLGVILMTSCAIFDADTKDEEISLNESRIIDIGQKEQTLEESLQKMIKIFDIENNFDSVNTEEYIEENEKVYYVYMNNSDSNKSVNIATDSYGNLIFYSSYQDDKEDLELKAEEDALKIANIYLEKLYPGHREDFVLNDNLDDFYYGDKNYIFQFQRTFKGRDILGDEVTIVIDSHSLEVESVDVNAVTNYDFTNTSYMDHSMDISPKNEAFEAYKEYNKIYPGYLKITESDKDKYIPAFELIMPQVLIDGTTLEPRIPTAQDHIYYGMDSAVGDTDEIEYEKYESDFEIGGYYNDVNMDKADKRARELLEIDKSTKLINSGYGSLVEGKDPYWILGYEDDKENLIDVSLLAEDLSLISYNYYGGDSSGSKNAKKKSLENAVNIAEKFLVDKAGINKDEIELINNSEINQGDYSDFYLSFIRKIGSEYILNDIQNITVNAYDCKVNSFTKKWDRDFEEDEYPVEYDIDEIYDTLVSQNEFELVYHRDYTDEDVPVKLYYQINPTSQSEFGFLLNQQGKLIDYNGRLLNIDGEDIYPDIDKAQDPKMVRELAKEHIYYPSEKLNPQDPLLQIDLVKLLLTEVAPISDIISLSENNLKNRAYFIKNSEWNPGKEITQREIAKYLVRMNNMEELAEMKNIFRGNFKDIDQNDPDFGYLIIAREKGFIDSIEENMLEPDLPITRELGLEYYRNYLEKVRE